MNRQKKSKNLKNTQIGSINYQALFDSIDEGFCVVEVIFDEGGNPADFRYLKTNAVFARQMELENPEGKTALELSPNIEKKWIEIYGRVAATGKSVRFTVESAPSNNWFDIFAMRAGDSQSRLVVIFIREVTRRRKVEEALRESEERLRLATRAGEMFAWEVDLETGRSAVGENFAEVVGISPEDFPMTLDEAITKFIHPDDAPTVAAEVQKAIAGNGFFRKEYRLLNPLTKEIRWVESHAKVVGGAGNSSPRRFVGITQQITQRKRAERELAAQRRIYKSVTDNATTALFIMDERQHCVFMNPAAEKLTGYTFAETLGRPLHEVVHHTRPDGSFYPLSECPIDQAFPTSNQMQGEEIFVHKDGHFYDVAFTASPLLDENGNSVGTVIEVQDIVERKRREANLAFLAEISRSLTNLSDRNEIIKTCAAKIGEYFRCDQCVFADFDKQAETANVIYSWGRDENVFDTKGTYRIADFVSPEIQNLLSAGKPAVIADTNSDERIHNKEAHRQFGIVSSVTAPYVSEGSLRAAIGLNCSTKREWRGDEIILLQELTRRIWTRLERAFADESLRQSEQRFRMMANTSPSIVWTAAPDGTITFNNPQWLEYTGLTAEQNAGNWAEYVLHPDDYERCLNAWQHALETGDDYEIEVRNRRFDGEYRWFLTRAVAVRSNSGEIVSWFGSSTDIHDKKIAEEKLRLSEERIRLALQTGNGATWDINLKTGETIWSESHFRLLGCSPSENGQASFEMWRKKLHPADAGRVLQTWENAKRTHKIYESEYRIVRADNGEVCWFSAIGQFFYDRLGEPMRSLGVFFDITKLKQAEAEILEKDEILTRITDVTPTLLAHCSRELRYLFVNRTTADFLGFAREEIIGKPIVEIMGEAAFETIKPYVEKVLQGERVEFEIEVPYATAGKRFMHVVYVPERNETGEIVGWFATIIDVTERRRAEETKSFLASIIETSDDAVITKNLDGIITSWNKGAERIFGYSAKEAIGKPIMILIPPHLSQEEEKILENLRKGQPIKHYDTIRRRKDGTLLDISLTISPIFDSEGKIVGASKIARDITERRQAEENLRISEERYRALVEASAQVVWFMDAEGQGDSHRHWFSKLTGIPLDEVKGKGYLSFVHPDDRAALQEVFRKVWLKPQAYEVEFRLAPKGNRYHFYNLRGVPILNKDGTLREWMGTVKDITETKMSELRLALLAEISEIIRHLTNPLELLFTVSEKLGQHLDVRRCLFNEIDIDTDTARINRDYCNEVESVAGEYKISDYSAKSVAEMQKGKTVVNFDSKTDKRTAQDYLRSYEPHGERAYIAVPLMRDGRWVASLWASDDRPRHWTREEVSLLKTVAERTWTAVEKLRIDAALRESEERFSKAFNASPLVLTISSLTTGELIEVNETFVNVTGFSREEAIGKTTIELGLWASSPDREEEMEIVRKEGKLRNAEYVFRIKSGAEIIGLLSAEKIEIGGQSFALTVIQDITERKLAEERLRYQLQLTQNITDSAAVAIFVSDRNGKINFINPEAEKIFGYKLEEIAGRNLHETIHYKREDGSPFPQNTCPLSRVYESGESVRDYEGTFFRKDGSAVSIICSNMPIIENGQITGEVMAMLDISRRKEAEENLRRSEQFHSIISDISTDWAFSARVEPDGRVVTDSITAGFTKQLGYTLEEFRENGGWEILVHPDDLPEAAKQMKKLLGGETIKGELRHITKNGEILISEYQTSPIFDENGRVVRIFGASRDITAQKQSEQALQDSEERLRNLIESATEYAIFTMSLDGVINSWSAGAERIFGFKPDEIMGQATHLLFTPEDNRNNAPQNEMETALRTGRAPDERFHLRRDGTRFYVSGVLMPLTKSGTAEGFVKIARDLTAQMVAEKALRDKEMLQKLVGAQEDERRRIARDLHDELGQQLTALRLKLENARRICLDEAVCNEIDKIQLVAKQIDNGVDFLAWELRPAALDDLGLFAALEKYVHEWSHYAGTTAELLPSSLKGKRFLPEVEINLYRIAQEALNNVYKYAEAGRAEIVLEKRENVLILIIADNGNGFNPEDNKIKNKGIGLIGMRERAALIGGNLEIESAVGQGTTVFVRVPIESI